MVHRPSSGAADMPRFHLFPHCFERFPFDMPAVHLIHAHAIPLPVPEMGKQNRQNVKGSANGNHSPIECSFRFSLRQINSHCPRSAPSGPPVCFCCFIHIVAPHPPISTPTTPLLLSLLSTSPTTATEISFSSKSRYYESIHSL